MHEHAWRVHGRALDEVSPCARRRSLAARQPSGSSLPACIGSAQAATDDHVAAATTATAAACRSPRSHGPSRTATSTNEGGRGSEPQAVSEPHAAASRARGLRARAPCKPPPMRVRQTWSLQMCRPSEGRIVVERRQRTRRAAGSGGASAPSAAGETLPTGSYRGLQPAAQHRRCSAAHHKRHSRYLGAVERPSAAAAEADAKSSSGKRRSRNGQRTPRSSRPRR